MSNRVLLVDDDLHILRAAEFKLKRRGYDVKCAFNGEEAWQLIERELPDILVTDLQMPRLSGTELIRRIRRTPRTAKMPVIMLTAKGFELPKDEMADIGVFEVVGKPFSPRDLCNRVQAALDEAGTDWQLATTAESPA